MICNNEEPILREVQETHDDEEERALAAACEMPIPVNNGMWTVEEVDYMLALIEAFKAGYLDLKNGTTLRSFLAKMLSCKAKRISKRFEGLSIQGIGYNGRQTYKRCPEAEFNSAEAREARESLGKLEWRYLKSEVKPVSVLSGCSDARKTLMVREQSGKRDHSCDGSVSSTGSRSDVSTSDRPLKKRKIHCSGVVQHAEDGREYVASSDCCNAVSTAGVPASEKPKSPLANWLDSLLSNAVTKNYTDSLIGACHEQDTKAAIKMSVASMQAKVDRQASPQIGSAFKYQARISAPSRFDSAVNRYVL